VTFASFIPATTPATVDAPSGPNGRGTMSIDIEIGSGLSNEDAAHFAAKTEAVTIAMQRVQEEHAAYSWAWTDEIRCRGCNTSLDIPILASTKANADKAFQAHQAAELDVLLAGEDELARCPQDSRNKSR
jgi:hypothetical protein